MKSLLAFALLSVAILPCQAQNRVACISGNRVWGNPNSWDAKVVPTGKDAAVVFGAELLVEEQVDEPDLTVRIGSGSTLDIQANFRVNYLHVGRAGGGSIVQQSGNVEARVLRVQIDDGGDSSECSYELSGGNLTVDELHVGSIGTATFTILGSSNFNLNKRLFINPGGELIIRADKTGFPKFHIDSDLVDIKPESKLTVNCSTSLPVGKYVVIASPEKLGPKLKANINIQDISPKLKAEILDDEPGLVIQISANP